jgi:hopene-associated glycosyltransferase HpnB
MLVILFILSTLATLSALAWLFILFHPARPWDFHPVGDDEAVLELPAGAVFPPVSILVPARNEADSLPATLPALLSQDYPGQYNIYLVDDRSADGTADVARKLAAQSRHSERLHVLSGAALPERWVGKMWALHQAAKAALATGGVQFVMLTDADILHSPESLRRLVSESQNMKLGLNSRMARLRCVSKAEKLLIPAFVYFFNLLYPMRRVNHPGDKTAAAAGGCVLLSREALEKMGGGFEALRDKIIDDVNLGRTVKGHGLPIRLSLSRSEVKSLREYPVLADIWKMVTRTAFTELNFSYLRLAGAMLGLMLLFVVPLIALIGGSAALLAGTEAEIHVYAVWAVLKGIIGLSIMRTVYGPAVKFFELPQRYAWSLPIAGVLYGLMTFDSALKHLRGEGLKWRDKA